MNSDLDDLVSADLQRSPGVQIKDTALWSEELDAWLSCAFGWLSANADLGSLAKFGQQHADTSHLDIDGDQWAPVFLGYC